MRFKKSTYSTAAEDCVEIALPQDAPAPIHIRDSKRPGGPTLRVAAEPYRSFTLALRRGALRARHDEDRKARARQALPIP
ncbi:DUF397 domain-containing protein [Streptomyces roseoverticillatus]|uniref:DUF397 domain-containing protein n=1 Tax=Streptomyces roseoverticillatus TaxID=66429 RepID=UPI0027E3BB10|nr:DUF397 domain-containing protein [Streptomyces roseoverticillatus]MCF3103913.1 DUF397 domain-containing protein [Streptomyces roseoverticillatus]